MDVLNDGHGLKLEPRVENMNFKQRIYKLVYSSLEVTK